MSVTPEEEGGWCRKFCWPPDLPDAMELVSCAGEAQTAHVWIEGIPRGAGKEWEVVVGPSICFRSKPCSLGSGEQL